jgi:protein YibB
MVNDTNEITIVTAFYDIGRGDVPSQINGFEVPSYIKRTNSDYFSYFAHLAEIRNPMIIFTSENHVKMIESLRLKTDTVDKTKIVVTDSYLPLEMKEVRERIKSIQQDPVYISKVANTALIEYWNPDYVLLNILKSFYVTFAIKKELIDTELVSWIDFGYCRNATTLSPSKKWKYNFDPQKIHMFNQYPINPERAINDIIFKNDVYIQGCHIVGGTKKWEEFRNIMVENLNELLNNNLIDDDQTLLLMTAMKRPDLVELHPSDPNNWFLIFNNYNNEK